MQVSILIPAYKEAAHIPATVAALHRAMARLSYTYEIVICDDGSDDGTPQAVATLHDPLVRCVTGPHLGKGGALARGVAAAEGAWIFYTDADLAYGTEVIGEFLTAFEERETDLVIGSRPLHKEGYRMYPLLRRLISRVYRAALQLWGGVTVSDAQCGCKAYRTAVAKRLFADLIEVGFAFETETLLRARLAGNIVTELPVRVISNGPSHVRPLRDGLRMLRAAHRIKKTYM